MTRVAYLAIIILLAALSLDQPHAESMAHAQASSLIEKAEPVVQAQITESLNVVGVGQAHDQLNVNGDGVGILVIDDWNSIIPGIPHGASVVEIVRKTAPGAEVWTCKLDFSVALISDFLNCLEEIETRELNVKIVNMSFSMGDKFYSSPCGNDLTEFGRAIHRLSQRGIIFVGSAGNQGVKNGLKFPGCHEDVIAVGATYDYDGSEVSFEGEDFNCEDIAKLDKIACYSNRAKYLDLLAPGTTVSTSVNPRFGGTSASAPIVTGIIAMMLSKSPQLTRSEILRILKNTGKPVYDGSTRKSMARVDALAALTSIAPVTFSRTPSNLATADHNLANFDANLSGHIEDDEFFQAVELWIHEQINDEVFFRVIDAWSSQAAVQSVQPLAAQATLIKSKNLMIFSAGVNAETTRVTIFDQSGHQVYASRALGKELRWNLLSREGRPLANGVYFFLLESEKHGQIIRTTGQLALLR